MKYELNNLEFTIKEAMVVKLEKVSIEYNVEELAQFATNTVNIVTAIKEAVRDLAPIVSAEIENAKQLKHTHRIEEMEMQAKLSA
jgi:ribosomal protein S3AE